jgi:hypothetical protein
MDSRAEIKALLARYCFLHDDGDVEGYADLFLHGTLSGRSREEILERHRNATPAGDAPPALRHQVTNIHIEIDEQAGTARSRCYLILWRARPDAGFEPVQVCSYHDTFHRVDGAWFFATRRTERHLQA